MLFQFCSVEAGDSGWSRGAIRRRGARSSIVRTGQRSLPQAVEHKYNHNHDPRNGQFTFAAGGLFADVARQGGKTGITARKLNRIVSDPKAAETINPLGHPVTIARTGGNSVELTGPLGAFQAIGRFQRVPGRQGLTI